MQKICDGYFAEWFRITISQNTRRRFSAFRILPLAPYKYKPRIGHAHHQSTTHKLHQAPAPQMKHAPSTVTHITS